MPEESTRNASASLSAYGKDHLEHKADGQIVLTSGFSKGWRARKPATLTSAEHPGTAVSWDGSLFEVVEAVALPDGWTRYRLDAWNSRHAIRVIEMYDSPSEEARHAQQQDRREAIRHRRGSILLAPLLGLLPGEVQKKTEGDFGAPALATTLSSILPLLVLGTVGLLSSRIALMGGGIWFVPWLTRHPQISAYLFLESMIRLGVVVVQGEPIGSLPGVLGYELWRRATGRQVLPTVSPSRHSRWKPEDTFRMLEPVLSFLSPEEQETLEKRFGFDPLKWGKRAAIGLSVVSILNIIISLGALAESRDTLWDALWLVAGGYLLFEQLVRWRDLAAGRPAASVLGVFVRPFARRLLDAPTPE